MPVTKLKRLFIGAIAVLLSASPTFASEKMTLAKYKEKTIDNAYELSD